VDFNTMDYGTKPTNTKLEIIEVAINTDQMVGDYAHAYAKELYRLNPVRAREANITREELNDYFEALIAIRVESVNDTCRVWREARMLAVPAWMQHTISTIGEVIDRVKGLHFKPKYVGDYNMVELLDISNRLQSFIDDGLSLHVDAFPREKSGNIEVMGMVILGDYVHSIKADAHPSASYVAAFLGNKLVQEQSYAVLYRVRYDDVNFIATQLMSDRGLRS
jgi:hypothetical protein